MLTVYCFQYLAYIDTEIFRAILKVGSIILIYIDDDQKHSNIKYQLITYKVFLEKSRKESPIQKWTKDMIKP